MSGPKLIINSSEELRKLEEKTIASYRKRLGHLANAAHGEWQDEAGRQLHKTRIQYQKALKLHKIDEDTWELILHHPDEKTNWLVTAIEVGYNSFDIKPGLLSSPSAQVWSQYSKRAGQAKKGAPFLDVPFRTGPALTQAKPDKFRRVSPGSRGWMHPGFKPEGGGGLSQPLHQAVKAYIKEQAQVVFAGLIGRVSV
jgi:hypothetical protein